MKKHQLLFLVLSVILIPGCTQKKDSDLAAEKELAEAKAAQAKAEAEAAMAKAEAAKAQTRYDSYSETMSEKQEASDKDETTSSSNNYYGEIITKGNWRYNTQQDPMTDEYSYLANCVSENSQLIGNHSSKLNLFVIHNSHGNYVNLCVSDGILRQDRLPVAHVRFDNGEVKMWSVIPQRKTIHYIVAANDFIQKLKSSSRCAIKIECEDGSTATYTFRTAGLQWKY